MSKRLDHILVVDIEATCWEVGRQPAGEVTDIIEIGVCPVQVSTLTQLEKRSILIRPERSSVSEFCTRLTTLTPAQVEAGVTFAEACQVLEKEYRSAERVWASFGDYDRKQIQRQCDETGVRYPFGPRHLNVKTLFALVRGLPHEVGTAQAVQMCGRTLEGTHHRGHDDAWNIAGVLIEVLKAARG
ncbi:MAG: exonuclease domain-containing protein [Fimbriiglobus sp.]|jgi:inhibitor of KinA sporulation pathway (predicted exonuclease)|nr:exonuclease domain-containing protein [Fimbriiglobus sp.]